MHSAYYGKNFKIRATARFHKKAWFDAVRLAYEPANAGKRYGTARNSFIVPDEQHGFAVVRAIAVLFGADGLGEGAEHDRTCVLFVQWLDGMYKSNANKGQSIYQAAQPISRSMGHMHLAKSYGRGEDSAYQLQTVSSGSVLAPVWLVPDQSCKDGSTFFAIKNDELPGFDQNATL